MQQDTQIKALVRRYLPPGSTLAMLDGPLPKPAVVLADFAGSGAKEVAAGYIWSGHPYVMILRYDNHAWHKSATVEGSGYAISYLGAAKITSPSKSDLIIGWQRGAIWSELVVCTYTDQGWKKVPGDLFYSQIEVEDMPGKEGRDGRAEIALWQHDTGRAYKVKIYRYQDGKWTPATDVYPYYFKKVAAYYEQRVREEPKAAFYRYYLADAQLKAGMPEQALLSIQAGLALSPSYPPPAAWLALKKQAMEKQHTRQTALYPASIKQIGGTNWGYIDAEGRFFIAPTYSYANPFQANGLAVVEEKGRSGVINSSGAFVIEPKYEYISPFTEGLAIVNVKDGFAVINEQGDMLTTKLYSYIAPYHEGRAVFQDSEFRYGYLDTAGREAIPPIYKEATDFHRGKAVVKVKDGLYALITIHGDIIIKYPYAFVGNPGDGLLAFRKTEQGKYGYMDEGGHVIITPRYTSAQPFQNGRAVVNLAADYTNEYGLIDRSGAFIIQPQFNDIEPLGEGRFAVGVALDSKKPFIGSMYAIYDKDGNKRTDFIYENVMPYKQGVASVHNRTETFFIDTSGRRAEGWPVVSGTGTLTIEGALIRADIDNRLSYVDRSGRVVWQQNTVIPLRGTYKVKEEKFKPNKDYLVYYPQVTGLSHPEVEASINKKLRQQSGIKEIDPNVQLDYNYLGDFTVWFFRKNLLVIKLIGYQYYFGAAHGMPTEVYPHIDLQTGRFYELKDLFKKNSDYVKVLSSIIEQQIKTNPKYSYIWQDQYKGIAPNQPFYVGEHALYIYFTPYEIAAYVAGFPTFTIPYVEIMNIIDTQGAFWRSFH
ncbi:WG repeat-containing protein [Aneurinibacillus sp. REN35]|uniref:WG repeat-containing protein n=1 Tax=Aneurinibacillus sp. REN35 TaxID=3237286 RepID=UPI0035298E9D